MIGSETILFSWEEGGWVTALSRFEVLILQPGLLHCRSEGGKQCRSERVTPGAATATTSAATSAHLEPDIKRLHFQTQTPIHPGQGKVNMSRGRIEILPPPHTEHVPTSARPSVQRDLNLVHAPTAARALSLLI
ncbi:hypothetical protein PoB_007313700 [Plakobranchus ocellatus]|uniref:Uncharacterized protein n=1 Tax=Plakobranchus ocellatus TaxID=259542 RepID=A0AAV4DQT0_9GAST|nr:hypothetical protein PoB_007313700 [Plakobranchus ocellatus]